jgi:hypothetical protein
MSSETRAREGEATALKFAPGSRRTAEAAAMASGWAATVRYQDEKGIAVGDRLILHDQEAQPFGEATVQATVECPVSEAVQVIERHEARHRAGDASALRSLLDHHYDADIGLGTAVKVVVFAPELPPIDYRAELMHHD